MKHPGAFAALFGNPVIFFILGTATVIVGIMALNIQGWGLPALVMLGLMGYATASNRKLTAYKKWQREWDAMAASTEAKRPGKPMPWLRYVMGVGAWLVGACMAMAASNDPGYGLVVVMFWLVSLAGGAALTYRLATAARRHSSGNEAKVEICLSIPLQSVPVAQTYEKLPPYCLDFLR